MPKTSIGNNKEEGMTLLELLIAIAIVGFIVSSLLGLTSISLKATDTTRRTNQANNIAQEMFEQVRNFRDGTIWDTDGLGTLSTNTDYYIQKSGAPEKWEFSAGTKTEQGFTKKVVFEDVFRDTNDDIVSSGGDYDPETKKILISVSWKEKNNDQAIQIEGYLTNWRK